MGDTHELSRTAYDRLKAELEELSTKGRVDIARKIETARELGDLSENGDYHAAKEEQGKMEGRIRQLTGLIENAVVVDAPAATGRVTTGSIVTVRYEGDTDTERYLVGSIEERVEGVEVASPGSPLGQALMGAAPGDTVSYEAPGGALKVEIVEVGA
jgi:transcription elongation factor GreA